MKKHPRKNQCKQRMSFIRRQWKSPLIWTAFTGSLGFLFQTRPKVILIQHLPAKVQAICKSNIFHFIHENSLKPVIAIHYFRQCCYLKFHQEHLKSNIPWAIHLATTRVFLIILKNCYRQPTLNSIFKFQNKIKNSPFELKIFRHFPQKLCKMETIPHQ